MILNLSWQSFAKFVKFLFTQQLLKLCNLYRESGNVAVTSSGVSLPFSMASPYLVGDLS